MDYIDTDLISFYLDRENDISREEEDNFIKKIVGFSILIAISTAVVFVNPMASFAATKLKEKLNPKSVSEVIENFESLTQQDFSIGRVFDYRPKNIIKSTSTIIKKPFLLDLTSKPLVVNTKEIFDLTVCNAIQNKSKFNIVNGFPDSMNSGFFFINNLPIVNSEKIQLISTNYLNTPVSLLMKTSNLENKINSSIHSLNPFFLGVLSSLALTSGGISLNKKFKRILKFRAGWKTRSSLLDFVKNQELKISKQKNESDLKDFLNFLKSNETREKIGNNSTNLLSRRSFLFLIIFLIMKKKTRIEKLIDFFDSLVNFQTSTPYLMILTLLFLYYIVAYKKVNTKTLVQIFSSVSFNFVRIIFILFQKLLKQILQTKLGGDVPFSDFVVLPTM